MRRKVAAWDENAAEDNVVDLVECEAGGLDGRVGQGSHELNN